MGHLTISKIIARSALSKFATRLYPFETRDPFQATRGHIENDLARCIMCSLCQKKCPNHAITVTKAAGNWEIDRMKCIQCSACVDACPVKCLSMAHAYSPASAVKESFIMHQETPPPKPGAAKQEPAAA